MIDEMKSIVEEVWSNLGIGKIPKVETKKGGYTAAYYPHSHTIRFRENSWNKLPNLFYKRVLVIHECFHAAGHDHSVRNGIYLSSFDLLSLCFYEKIYGEDHNLKDARLNTAYYVDEYLQYTKSLKR